MNEETTKPSISYNPEAQEGLVKKIEANLIPLELTPEPKDTKAVLVEKLSTARDIIEARQQSVVTLENELKKSSDRLLSVSGESHAHQVQAEVLDRALTVKANTISALEYSNIIKQIVATAGRVDLDTLTAIRDASTVEEQINLIDELQESFTGWDASEAYEALLSSVVPESWQDEVREFTETQIAKLNETKATRIIGYVAGSVALVSTVLVTLAATGIIF